MGLFIQTNCDSGCRISPFSMSIFLFVTLSTVVSMIAAETVTTPFKTTTPSPAPSHAPSLIPSLDNECAESCETCPKNDSNSCLTCKDNLTLNPAENCTDIFISCNASEACMNECYDTDTVSCQCLLKHRDEKCKECIEELNNMYGTCIKADKCPRDTQSTDEVFSDLKNGTMPICLICEKLFIGYCVDIYIIGIVLIPISILVVLCILVGVAIRCYIQRRRGGGMEMECCCTLSSVKPPPPVRKDYTSRQQSFQTDHRNNETETESDDVYGNVDDRNNIMLHNAPLNQQIDPSERPKMHLPQAAPHNPLLPGVRNTQDRFRNDNDRPPMQLPQPPRSAQIPNVGNRPTQDSAIPKDQGYIKMKDNVMVDVPRFPPGSSRHTSESEPEEQAVYGNDPNLARQVTAPTRRPPSIPLKPVSSTLPAGISSSDAGRINRGFNNDDDENPVDDYPDYPNDDDEQCDSIPLGYAPPPPVNHNRPGGGGHVAANELKQKLNSRMQKLRKESLSDLPEEPPPPVPSQGGRQPGGGKFNELQQKLKSRNEKTRNESLSDLPDRAPPPPNRTAQSRAQGGPFMSDLQKKFSNEFHGHMDGNKKPSLPPPVRVHATSQPDSDSDESQVDYEFVDYKDDKTSNTTPQSLTEPNVDRRPPIILPKSPTRTDQFNRPQVPFKKGPVMPPKKNQPPPLPKSPKPVADEQEVYEIMDTQEDDMSDRPVMPSDSFRENTRMPVPIDNRPRVPLPVRPGSSVPGEDRPRMPPPPLRGNKPKPVVIEEDDEVYEAVESPDAKDYGDNYEVPEKPGIQLECDDVYQNEPVMNKGKTGRYRNLPADKNPPIIGTENVGVPDLIELHSYHYEDHEAYTDIHHLSDLAPLRQSKYSPKTSWPKRTLPMDRMDKRPLRPRRVQGKIGYSKLGNDTEDGKNYRRKVKPPLSFGSLRETGMTLKIPTNAINETENISAFAISKNSQRPPLLQDDQYLIGPVISCRPDGIKFLQPVTISVPNSFINLSPKYLQIWCKSESSEALYEWQMIYDGIKANQMPLDKSHEVQVIVEKSKIKFRIKHFTLFSIVLAPFSKLMNWWNPEVVELELEIWAYLCPVNVTDKVLLRIYALQMNNEEQKHHVQMTELDQDAGRCTLPITFTLIVNKEKNLNVSVRDLYPRATWVTGDTKTSIPFRNLLRGGLGARCEFQFQLAEDVNEYPGRIGGAIDLWQDDNKFELKGNIHFDDHSAKKGLENQRRDLQPKNQRQPENLAVHENHDIRAVEVEHMRDVHEPLLAEPKPKQKYTNSSLFELKGVHFDDHSARKGLENQRRDLQPKNQRQPENLPVHENHDIRAVEVEHMRNVREPSLAEPKPKQKYTDPSLCHINSQDTASSPITQSVATLPEKTPTKYQGDPHLPFGGAKSGLFSFSYTEPNKTTFLKSKDSNNNNTGQTNTKHMTKQSQDSEVESPCTIRTAELSLKSMAAAPALEQTSLQHSGSDSELRLRNIKHNMPSLKGDHTANSISHQGAAFQSCIPSEVTRSNEHQSPSQNGNWNQVFRKIARKMEKHGDLRKFARALNFTSNQYEEIRKKTLGDYFIAFEMLNRWLGRINSSQHPSEVMKMLVEAIRFEDRSLAEEVWAIY